MCVYKGDQRSVGCNAGVGLPAGGQSTPQLIAEESH